MKYKKKVLSICVLFCMMSGCSDGEDSQQVSESISSKGDIIQEKENSFKFDEKEIIIPGIKESYEIIFVNDQHVLVPNGEYSEDKAEEIEARYKLFADENGKTSDVTWKEMVKNINQLEVDGVVLAGDMIDFYSQGNLSCLMESLKEIKPPTMYLRADHDLGVWYSNEISQETSIENHIAAWEMEEVMVQDYKEFMVVGVNNNTSQLSPMGLQKLEELWTYNKPIILAVHVPVKSQISGGLSEASKAVWQDRALMWGNDCYYVPDNNTQRFLEMIFQKNSPVVAVIGAHLHFPYDENLNENIRQIVFDASYKGTMGRVTVKGK